MGERRRMLGRGARIGWRREEFVDTSIIGSCPAPQLMAVPTQQLLCFLGLLLFGSHGR